MSLVICGCTPAPSKVSVTFDANGGLFSNNTSTLSVEYEKGSKIGMPIDPSRNGYDIVKENNKTIWKLGDEKWSFVGYTISENMTLKCDWSVCNYTIEYILDGGTNDSNNPDTYNIEETVLLKSPSKFGYSFLGWKDSSGSFISKIDKGTTGNKIFTATWKRDYEVIAYSNDESKGTVSGSGSYSIGSLVTVVAICKQNCVFKGWYSDNSFTSLISEEATYSFTLNDTSTTLYAKFLTLEEEKQEEKQWSIDHGIIPFKNGNYITYGMYPQTHVSDESLISNLNLLSEFSKNKFGYYFYNNEYYFKQVNANTLGSDYKFYDGTRIIKGETYWFKVEAIKWKILTNDENKYSLISDFVLDCIRYNEYYENKKEKTEYKTGKRSKVYANNYEFSEVRTWLNTSFYEQAFFLNDSDILTSLVDNSLSSTTHTSNDYICDNTNTKFICLVYKNYKMKIMVFSLMKIEKLSILNILLPTAQVMLSIIT